MSEALSFEELLKREGRLVFPNKGNSMMPILRQNRDLMVLVRKDLRPFGLHDAVLFHRVYSDGRDEYVMHRIVRRCGDGSYWITGDNRLQGEKVREDQILAVLTAIVRDGREISVEAPLYRLYVLLWGARPNLRRILTWPRRLAGRWLRRLRRSKKP